MPKYLVECLYNCKCLWCLWQKYFYISTNNHQKLFVTHHQWSSFLAFPRTFHGVLHKACFWRHRECNPCKVWNKAWMAAPTFIRPLPNGILLFNWRKRLAMSTWSSVFCTKIVDASRSRFPILVWRGARRSPNGIPAASWVSCATISFNGLEHASYVSMADK